MAEGDFAATQAAFFRPDPQSVSRLRAATASGALGIVAHFYMDPSIQSALYPLLGRRVHIADSLAMAGSAIRMAEDGCRSIAVLGVDFMAENVRALLDRAGFEEIPVYRLAREAIGCSLAEAADAPAYARYLESCQAAGSNAHVIYVNTSLPAKTRAAETLPTLTCTSSNVIRSLVHLAVDAPETALSFGPDAYMGANVRTHFEGLRAAPVEALATLHPDFDHAALEALLSRYSHFREGHCIVHHNFGADITDRIAEDYADAYLTAHFEVPGELFGLAQEASRAGRGVVGSTSHILNFIRERVAATKGSAELRFVLGTESGMSAAIVSALRPSLAQHPDISVEIIFPVADDAVTPQAELGLMPGAASAEGCSPAGGCATCPYMKMNRLSTLCELADAAQAGQLGAFEAYKARYPKSEGSLDAGIDSMLYMQQFQEQGRLPQALLARIHSGS